MQIRDERLEEFTKLYEQEFGEKLARQEAYDRFLHLINVLRVIVRPPRDEGV